MSANKMKYIVLPYEGRCEKLVDVRESVPQHEFDYKNARKFLDYVYLLEEIALCVKVEDYAKASDKIGILQNGEFITFKAAVKKEDKNE